MKKAKIYSILFADVYPLYINKIERKGRSQVELEQLICWLSGHTSESLEEARNSEMDLEAFIKTAPALNPNRKLITGMICGYRVEEIEDEITQEIRFMDKIVDELAKGRKLDSIMRRPKGDSADAR